MPPVALLLFALAAGTEAVDMYRVLAQREPQRLNPDLASSLSNLSNRLSDAGGGPEALAAITEDVEIRRSRNANPSASTQASPAV